jgi:hypothetical protein
MARTIDALKMMGSSRMVIDPMLLVAQDQAAAWAGFWANVFVAVATTAAVVVALHISIVQFRRDAAKEKRIAVAIAPALIGDLNYVLESVETISGNAFAVKNARVAHHEQIEEVLKAATRIRLPAFERFKGLLPTLGDREASVVIECYATIARVVTLVEIELKRELPTQELLAAVVTLTDKVGSLKARIQAAQDALRPMVIGTYG